MAIAFARMSIHSRSKGHSAIAAAAYRAGEKLYCDKYGQTHDYQHRHDVMHSEILLPEKAHKCFLNREKLWNAVEKAEKRKNSQLAKELVLALPKELSLEDQTELAKRFAYENFVKHGLAVDLAIHDKGEGNPHAHLLITTRRIIYNRLDKYKARDLNPLFYGKDKSKVYDPWNEKWRDFQNGFFIEKNLSLRVDANYIIPTEHEGRIRSKTEEHFIAGNNKLLIKANQFIATNSIDKLLSTISKTHAVFGEQEMAAMVFKNAKSNADFQIVLAKLKAHPDIIQLGFGEDGRLKFTTKENYQLEQRMINRALTLLGRKDKSQSLRKIDKLSKQFTLREEQKDALTYIAQSGDISCLIGRAGAGKTHLMKAVNELYSNTGKKYKIYGAVLSGIAAKRLEDETGIKSDTIYSLVKRIENGKFQPKSNSVIVIDEAGMVANHDMATIVNYAKKHHIKLVLVGDPQQLQPIGAGAPFKAIAEHVGCFEMNQIVRQNHARDREASLNLAMGRTRQAIEHYASIQSVQINNKKAAQEQLIDAWSQGSLLKDNLIISFTRAEVAELNLLARQKLIAQSKLSNSIEEIIKTRSGNINLSSGDRILFMENNRKLGVQNGEFATIKQIHSGQITALMDDGRIISFNAKKYKDFNYGYAATVHKSQGGSFEHVFVYAGQGRWDRHLAYVALTRHKESVKLYADKERFYNLDKLIKEFSRSPLRDNAVDYPLSYAERRGFDPESHLGKAVNNIAGIAESIKNKWLYLTNYEAWVIKREREEHIKQSQSIRNEAKLVAEYCDLNRSLGREWSGHYRNTETGNFNKEHLIALGNKRNELAFKIKQNLGKFDKALAANGINLDKLNAQANHHIYKTKAQEWNALRVHGDIRVKALLKEQENISKAQDIETREAGFKAYDKATNALLHSNELVQVEKMAPNVIDGLRERLYQKYLSPKLREVLLSPDWDKLVQAENPAYQTRFKLLKNLRDNALNLITEKRRLQYQISGMLNSAEKMMKSNIQSTYIKELAPNLAKAFEQHLPELTRQHALYKGMGRTRVMGE